MAHSHHPRHNQSRSTSTFLYSVYDNTGEANNETLAQLIANENKPNISIFRLRRDGSLVSVPLRYNPKAFSSGYAGTVNSLTASPDGRFLIAECQNTHEDNYSPIFLQYRIQPDGQIKPYARFSGPTLGGRSLVFHPSGRYAYLSCPDPSPTQSGPGTIAEFHVTSAGDILYPPFATVPCSPKPSALALDSQGRVGAVVDADSGFVWQYTLTPQGRLVPANPPSVPVARAFTALMAGNGQSLYVPSQQSRERYRMYQLRRNSGGGFSLLMPWAIRLPGVIWSVVVSNKRRLMYVSSGGKLLLFHISPQGTLQQSHYSLSTKVGLNLAVDEATGYLYVMGLYNFLHTYRIGQDGKLSAVGKHPIHVNLRLSHLTIVHR